MSTNTPRQRRPRGQPNTAAWARLDEQLRREDEERAARVAAKQAEEDYDPIGAWLDSLD